MLYNIQVKGIDLSQYQDQYLLIVNIASQCGFHHQFAELEKIHQREGVCVIAFPSHQFHQHDDHCVLQPHSFLVTESVSVNGEKTHPLFAYLKTKAKGLFYQESILWNYTKFLVYPKETSIKRFSPFRSVASIERYL